MPGAPSPQSPRFPQYQGFQPLSHSGNMANNQHLDDIPLERVVTGGSVTGARKPSSTTAGTTAAGSNNEENEKGPNFRPGLGRRKTHPLTAVDGAPAVEDGALTVMGKIYQKIINFSVVTRYFIYVLPLAVMIAIPISIGATVASDTRIGGVKMLWLFTWIEIGTFFQFLVCLHR